MKFTLLTAFLLLSFLNTTAQTKLKPVVIYLSDGEKIKGKIDEVISIGPELEVYHENKKENIAKSKIDSVLVNGIKYISEHRILSHHFIRYIEKGLIDIYEIDNRILAISREGSQRYRIPKRHYGKAYNYFCRNSWNDLFIGMNKEEFIDKVEEYNSMDSPSDPVLYDSISKTSKTFLLRLSFYRPEAGLELKISDKLSFFNSMGINISGNFLRGAETFINYDYSGELRVYYNRLNRLNKGYDIYNFSGPFIAATYKYFIENNIENRHAVGLLRLAGK